MTDDRQTLTNDELDLVFAAFEHADTSTFDEFDDDGVDDFGDDDGEQVDDDLDEHGQSPELALADFEDLAVAPGLLERLAGIVAAFALTTCCMMLMGATTEPLLSPVAVGMILAIVTGGLIASHGPRMLFTLAGICLGFQALDAGEAASLRDMCMRGRRLCYAGAALQLVASAMVTLENLPAPNGIGPAIANALAAVAFAVLLAELGFGSARHWVRTCLY